MQNVISPWLYAFLPLTQDFTSCFKPFFFLVSTALSGVAMAISSSLFFSLSNSLSNSNPNCSNHTHTYLVYIHQPKIKNYQDGRKQPSLLKFLVLNRIRHQDFLKGEASNSLINVERVEEVYLIWPHWCGERPPAEKSDEARIT